MARKHYPIRVATLFWLPLAAGCIDMSQQEYDQAVRRVSIEQERLDQLRPAYDAARQEAMQVVVRELAGGTVEDVNQAALEKLNEIAAQAKTPPVDERKDALDLAVDQFTAIQGAIENMQSAVGVSNPAVAVMNKIKTPGTPENKRFEEVLAAMPEVQTYQRQRKRLEDATKAVLAAEAKLPGGAKTPAAN